MEAIGYFRHRAGMNRNEAMLTLPEAEAGFFQYCEQQGFQPVATFIERGPHPGPPPEGEGIGERGYTQLCDYLRQPGRGFTTVVLPRIEDLSDRPTEMLRRLVELEYMGARVLAVDSDAGALDAAIALWRDRRDQEKLSPRAMEALRTKAMRGFGLGKTPYGYRLDQGGRLEVVPEESQVVVEIYRMYVEDGLGLRLIARKLNDDGTPTRRGSRWSVVTVRDILRNRTYTGTYARFGVRVPGNHTAIVGIEVYREAQRKREASSGPRAVTRQRVFALSGLGCCGACGGRMIGVSRKQSWSRKRDGGRTETEYRYYRCGSRVNQSVCSYHTWRADVLERQVVDQIGEALAAPPDGPFDRAQGTTQPARTLARSAMSTRLRALDRRLERYLDTAARGTLAAESLRSTVLPLVREARRLEMRLRALDVGADRGTRERSWRQQQRDELRDLKSNWNELTGDERRSYLGDLLNNVVVYDDHVELVLQA